MDNSSTTSSKQPANHPELVKKLDDFISNSLREEKNSQCGIIVIGPTGAGKTYSVELYLNQLKSAFSLLHLSHSQQQANIPYAGLKQGIAEYLRKVYKELDSSTFEEFSLLLKNKLGAHFPLLFDYIPELTLLTGQDPVTSPSPTPKVENQLYPLFKIFFEFISDFTGKPVLLFTDNLQWMDGSSANLLHYLLLHLPPKKLVWTGTCRNSKTDLERVLQLKETLNFANKNIELVHLMGLDASHTMRFLEEILGAPTDEKLARTFHELCEGNPSYMMVLAESLKSAQLIFFKKGIWQGKMKQINLQYKGQYSQHILWQRLKKLSPLSLELLSWLSCMGKADKQDLLPIFSGKKALLQTHLKEVMEAGLIERQNGAFRFSETHIGEVIFEGLPADQKSNIHYTLGKGYLDQGLHRLSRSEKVMAAQYLNQSLDQVKQNGDTLLSIILNLEVGKLQREDQAYEQARRFLKISEELCKEIPWDIIKDHFWETAMERATVEYHLGEYDLAEIHLDQLLERPLEPLKRAETFVLKITINNHLGRYRKVVTILHEALLELGLTIPSEERVLLGEIEKLKADISPELPTQSTTKSMNPAQGAILKLLYVGGMALHHTSDHLMTWAALQIIVRSKQRKEAGVKAIGYVSYGRMNIIAGDIDYGHTLGLKGIQINKDLDDLQYRCRVFGVFAFYIQPWKKAFRQSTSLLLEGMEAGRKSGDLIGLYILKTHLFNLHFISGQPIRSLLEYTFEESYPGRELTYYITHYQKGLIRYLCGDSAFFSIPRQQPSWLAARLTIQEERFYRNYVWARYYFLFGHYEQAIQCSRNAHVNRKLQEGSPLVPANLIILFLSITQGWHNQPRQSREINRGELQNILRQVEHWHHHSPSNYGSVFWLMKAEWSKTNSSSDGQTTDYYNNAIDRARESYYDLGLAHEFFAKFLLEISDIQSGKKHLEKAIESYTHWEGTTKADQLAQQYQFLLKPSIHIPLPDMETILRELSGDLELESLIKKLMVMLLRISGSTKTAIEWIENNGEVMEQVQMSLLKNTDNSDASIPSGLMLLCHRTQSPLIMNNLDLEQGYSEIGPLKELGIGSFMIIPISINGYLSMVVYLENAFAKDHYQEETIKWIRIIANQGGMIIENARTHEKTLQLNQEIQREMDEKQKLISFIEKQKNNHLRDLIQIQEDERKRIAGDLHDSLGSLLSTIKMQLNGLQENTPDNENKTKHRDTLQKMDEAIDEVRRIAHNMSPVSLRRFGLPSALQTLIEQINSTGQMQANLQVYGLEERIPEQTELTIYRICQELVQNAIKHSNASSLHLQLINHLDSINITVEDDGIGIDKEKTITGFGLQGIEAKVQMLNGQFSIESQPGKGCLAVVDIPI